MGWWKLWGQMPSDFGYIISHVSWKLLFPASKKIQYFLAVIIALGLERLDQLLSVALAFAGRALAGRAGRMGCLKVRSWRGIG